MKAATKPARANGPKAAARRPAKSPKPARRPRAAKRPGPPRAAGPHLAALHVRDVMTPEPVCAHLGDNVRDVARLLDTNEISGAPVVDDQERLVGVVSRTDLLHRLLEGPPGARQDEDWLDLLTADAQRSVDVDAARLGTVDDLMSVDPVTARPEERVATVARRMSEERVHRVVIVDENRVPVGIATTLDLLRVFPG